MIKSPVIKAPVIKSIIKKIFHVMQIFEIFQISNFSRGEELAEKIASFYFINWVVHFSINHWKLIYYKICWKKYIDVWGEIVIKSGYCYKLLRKSPHSFRILKHSVFWHFSGSEGILKLHKPFCFFFINASYMICQIIEKSVFKCGSMIFFSTYFSLS